jgi:1-acyl-sn-glycerol-3-phosphate acyltransferase
MRNTWLAARSVALWAASALHFAVGATFVAVLARLVGSKRANPLLKIFCRNVVRLTGARFRVVRSPQLNDGATHLFVANHVNVFDPFTIAAAIRQPVCGFELASHFDVPVYGLLMKAFGNIPVPVRPSRESIVHMRRSAAETLAAGTSLILFPEGTRTRSGLVGTFHAGALRLVAELGVPLVPVSQIGAFGLQHPGKSRLDPATVTVVLHDPIVTAGMSRMELDTLAERVREIVRGPVEGVVQVEVG